MTLLSTTNPLPRRWEVTATSSNRSLSLSSDNSVGDFQVRGEDGYSCICIETLVSCSLILANRDARRKRGQS